MAVNSSAKGLMKPKRRLTNSCTIIGAIQKCRILTVFFLHGANTTLSSEPNSAINATLAALNQVNVCRDFNSRPIDFVLVTDDTFLENEMAVREDRILEDEMKGLGMTVVRKSFLDKEFDWSQTKVAMLRSAWDRYEWEDEWFEFYDDVPKKTNLIHSVHTQNWLTNKTGQMQCLESKGINIIETVTILAPSPGSKERPPTLRQIQAEALKNPNVSKGWDTMVIKPRVGESGAYCFKVTSENIDEMEETFRGLLLGGEDMLVQPYQRSIIQGEISVIIFRERTTYSWPYAIRKVPGIDDLRVHHFYGGFTTVHHPTEEEIVFAHRTVDAAKRCGHNLLYARIDIIRDNDGELVLMEITAEGPGLFFEEYPLGAERFARALRDEVTQIKCSICDECNEYDGDLRLAQVVTPDIGGWPAALVGPPFYKAEVITCCPGDECLIRGGVDDDSDTCEECVVRSTAEATVSVRCQRFINKTFPINCCERFIHGDVSVFRGSNHLHFATMSSQQPIFNAMRRLYSDYPSVRYDGSVIFLHYENAYSEEKGHGSSNVPFRVQNSEKYRTVYRSLDEDGSRSLEDKRELAIRVHTSRLSLSDSAPFPRTYFSCTAAVKSGRDPDALFFVKESTGAHGEGVEIMSREQIADLLSRDECESVSWVIQEAVTDLAVLSGSRFDIRFYILFHAGRVYLHDNASIKVLVNSKFDPSNVTSTIEFIEKQAGEDDDVITAYTSKDRAVAAPFMDAIFAQLSEALPAMQDVLDITARDSTLYHIYGGDAMIRTNGKAVFTEFNDWPYTVWNGCRSSRLVSTYEIGPVSDPDEVAIEFYQHFVGEMYADFFAIVLGIADKNGDPSVICDGRVREVLTRKTCG